MSCFLYHGNDYYPSRKDHEKEWTGVVRFTKFSKRTGGTHRTHWGSLISLGEHRRTQAQDGFWVLDFLDHRNSESVNTVRK